ncbi:MAG: response regulator [Candidatus Omnitrophica bacterium]|nr:response regulator [Candidatus Omnitrophota bacterium]MDE2008857.1 response regulator [Candidatus Omnitrophota bacterium]MDE2213580.1 response regulator [Candidatus Omnitrophota bacterium]MDE2230519.1 response regulator [Candidatus Omnitrophota bacterium]
MNTHIKRLPEFYDLATQQATGKTILVVDDEVKIREMYKRILNSIGFDVVVAGNAMDAHSLLSGHRFDVVLLDINMEEVDGSILFDVIKLFHRDIKVVISSVLSIDEQKRRIKDADGYFDKSDDKDILLSMIYVLLQKPEEAIDRC